MVRIAGTDLHESPFTAEDINEATRWVQRNRWAQGVVTTGHASWALHTLNQQQHIVYAS